MDTVLKKEDYKFLRINDDRFVEETVRAEIELPEYMPEILRILNFSAVPKINFSHLGSGSATVDGCCELRFIYTASDGGIYCWSQTKQFNKTCDDPLFEGAEDLNVTASVTYVNCRATATKKAEMKAGINLQFVSYLSENEKVVSAAPGSGIEEKCVSLKAMSLGCKKTRSFAMSDCVKLKNAPVSFICGSRVSASVDEIRKLGSKIMIRGEAAVDIEYVTANEKSDIEHFRHTMPINQIMEFEDMKEAFSGNVRLNVSSHDITLKGSRAGENDMADIALSIDASVFMWEEKEMFVMTDAYSVEKPIKTLSEDLSFHCFLDDVNDLYTLRTSFSSDNTDIEKIISCVCVSDSGVLKYTRSELKLVGTLKIGIMAKDRHGETVYFEKNADYDYTGKNEYGDIKVFVCGTYLLKNFECTLSGGNEILLKADVSVKCRLFECRTVRAVTGIEETGEKFSKRESALTVYFPEKEESLWSIARRYGTTVRSIAAENELEGETTGSEKIIFIPTV